MTTGDSINPNMNQFREGLPEPIPYFRSGETGTGLWNHIFSHLRLKHRNTTTNPYLDSSVGYHTTFYEIRKSEHLGVQELWKQGPLYDHPLGWYFRKSSYTVRLLEYQVINQMKKLTATALRPYQCRHAYR